MNELKDFFLRMQKIAEDGDTERAHGDADDLLCELVTFLASRCEASEQKEITAILQLYNEMDKWYA